MNYKGNRFIGHMGIGHYPGGVVPFGTETDWIPFMISLVIDPGRQVDTTYGGDGTGVNVSNSDYQNGFGYITHIADQGKNQLPNFFSGPFQGGAWAGFVKYVPTKSSGGIPGYPNGVTLGLSFTDPTNASPSGSTLGGSCDNSCLVEVPAPPTMVMVELWDGAQRLTGGLVPRADLGNIRVTADGQMGTIWLPGTPYSPSGTGGGWNQWGAS